MVANIGITHNTLTEYYIKKGKAITKKKIKASLKFIFLK